MTDEYVSYSIGLGNEIPMDDKKKANPKSFIGTSCCMADSHHFWAMHKPNFYNLTFGYY